MKDNAKQTRYSKPNRILEPKENAIQMTSNLIYSIWIPGKQQISIYIVRSIMSRYPNTLYDQFAAQVNLQVKPQEPDIQISPNLIYDAISPPLDRI